MARAEPALMPNRHYTGHARYNAGSATWVPLNNAGSLVRPPFLPPVAVHLHGHTSTRATAQQQYTYRHHQQRNTMPCAAGELCTLKELTPVAPDGHPCRGGCGGRLHGLCGEPEQEGGSEIHRICPRCADLSVSPISTPHHIVLLFAYCLQWCTLKLNDSSIVPVSALLKNPKS